MFFPLHFRYGFGEAGKPKFGIEPNAELTYEVTLKSFEKVRKANFSKVVVGLCTYPSRRCALGGLTKWCLFLCLLLFTRDSCPHPATSALSLGSWCKGGYIRGAGIILLLCVSAFVFLLLFFFKLLGRLQDLFPYLFLGLFFFYFFSWVEDRKVHVLPSSSLGEVGVQLFRAERIVPFTGVSKRPPLGLQVMIPRSQPWRQQGYN